MTYLVGQLDRVDLDCARSSAPARCPQILETNRAELDRSCPAALQGVDRHARATHYRDFMNRYFEGHRHRLIEVPGAHHSARAMFDSAEGAAALFGPSTRLMSSAQVN